LLDRSRNPLILLYNRLQLFDPLLSVKEIFRLLLFCI